MNAEQFTYFLNGFLETANPTTINEEQTQIIKDHLKLVFNKITPDWSKLQAQNGIFIEPQKPNLFP